MALAKQFQVGDKFETSQTFWIINGTPYYRFTKVLRSMYLYEMSKGDKFEIVHTNTDMYVVNFDGQTQLSIDSGSFEGLHNDGYFCQFYSVSSIGSQVTVSLNGHTINGISPTAIHDPFSGNCDPQVKGTPWEITKECDHSDTYLNIISPTLQFRVCKKCKKEVK